MRAAALDLVERQSAILHLKMDLDEPLGGLFKRPFAHSITVAAPNSQNEVNATYRWRINASRQQNHTQMYSSTYLPVSFQAIGKGKRESF